ncbi:MAG: flavodoxin-dependent (E)-4-hydroxy-3-methylbut-2-enyl-diphosphate synthase [Mollicutes bacterium]|nr:flavodoxin-dependent (E)-4-hydroxy-3-methylbut-2-enyl-diphosphate synthase [Mollicutes bacterium]
MKRCKTRAIKVGNLQIGNQNKVIIQSMTNTKTKDIEATINQINLLAKKGCELVRLAILDEEDANAILKIKKKVNIPLVADIHFNYRLALLVLDNGIDKIRINPTNINKKEHIKAIVKKCKENKVPIRIGINSGSLTKEILKKYGKPTPEAMIESAKSYVKTFEDLDFYDICLSFKSSGVVLTIKSYELASKIFRYPLHLGVTEAGPFNISVIKSSAALGTLLYQGIGDTIRVSVTGPPEEEIIIAKRLLKSFGLIDNVPNLISCPTCGRMQYDMFSVIKEIESFLSEINSNIKVAIMGCAVNGPQEASRADVGVAGGKDMAMLFRKGKLIKTVKQEDLIHTLKEEIYKIINNNY